MFPGFASCRTVGRGRVLNYGWVLRDCQFLRKPQETTPRREMRRQLRNFLFEGRGGGGGTYGHCLSASRCARRSLERSRWVVVLR